MGTEKKVKKPESTVAAPRESGAPDLEFFGQKLRKERDARGLSLRELARQIKISPSMISQIERGLVMPSVSTLWSLATIYDISIDELFSDSKRSAGPSPSGTPNVRTRDSLIQRPDNRERIRLAGGVLWERLTAQPDEEVEFLRVVYPVGAESCPEDSLFRHGGKEYAYVMTGRLGLQIGFERYELTAGESLSFSAQQPHRLWAIGDEPAVAIWVIVNRSNDHRREWSANDKGK